MENTQQLFYVGSCRYQSIFNNYFCPRLHTTKEFIHFLLNYKTIDLGDKNAYYIYGGSTHEAVIDLTKQFIDKSDTAFNGINGLVLEVCSRKLYYNEGIPLNQYYLDEQIPNHGLEIKVLSNDEIIEDIITIKNILKNNFNIYNLIIIPHVNLPLRSTNSLILERNKFCNDLNKICEDLDIPFLDPAKINNEALNTKLYLEDLLPDGFHYVNNIYLNNMNNSINKLNLK